MDGRSKLKTHQYQSRFEQSRIRDFGWGSVLRGHNDSDPAPGIEVNFHAAPAGVEGSDQVVEQEVGEVFVKCALVAKCPEVQF